VTGASHARGAAPRSRFAWPEAWPCYLLVAFAALALAPAVPAGFARAMIAAPILLSVPGALALGAMKARRSFDAVGFGCLAAVLSTVMLAFDALALNAMQVRITATSGYVCLLVACVLLAAVAQLKLRRLRPGEAAVTDVLSPWPISSPLIGHASGGRETAVERAEEAARPRGRATRYALVAVAVGGVLLAGSAYGYLRAPHPAPVGYTWIAWTGPRTDGVIPVGPPGLTLPFQISHQQPAAVRFRLTADWTGGGRQHALAEPVTLRVGADKTVGGKLAIPQPPGGCAYLVVVSLTELGGAHPQTWTINAAVRASRGQAGCAR